MRNVHLELLEETEELKLTLVSHCTFWNLPARVFSLKRLRECSSCVLRKTQACFETDRQSARCCNTAALVNRKQEST
jgi:hypothetical protein